MTDNHRIMVALPAYNEAPYIGDIVRKVKEIASEVIVLDDGSTDDTAQEARDAGAVVCRYDTNAGYGVAVQRILHMARDRNPDVLVIMDSDTQHNPDEIPSLVKAVEDGYDLAIGSRNERDIPRMRRVGGKILRIATRLLSGVDVNDSQCGFRAYSRRAVEVIRPKENGMAVSSEIVALASWNDLRIIEVPISVRYTEDSSTHNPWKQGFYTLWRILVLKAKRMVSK